MNGNGIAANTKIYSVKLLVRYTICCRQVLQVKSKILNSNQTNDRICPECKCYYDDDLCIMSAFYLKGKFY